MQLGEDKKGKGRAERERETPRARKSVKFCVKNCKQNSHLGKNAIKNRSVKPAFVVLLLA